MSELMAGLGLLAVHVTEICLLLALAYVVIYANFGQRIANWWRPILVSSIVPGPERTRP